jgi:hypothetical protein
MRLPCVRFTVRRLMVLNAVCATLFGGIASATRTRSGQYFCWLGSQSVEVAAYFFPLFSWIARVGALSVTDHAQVVSSEAGKSLTCCRQADPVAVP